MRAVHATRGKFLRAEPIAAAYERGLVFHVGSFSEARGPALRADPRFRPPRRGLLARPRPTRWCGRWPTCSGWAEGTRGECMSFGRDDADPVKSREDPIRHSGRAAKIRLMSVNAFLGNFRLFRSFRMLRLSAETATSRLEGNHVMTTNVLERPVLPTPEDAELAAEAQPLSCRPSRATNRSLTFSSTMARCFPCQRP